MELLHRVVIYMYYKEKFRFNIFLAIDNTHPNGIQKCFHNLLNLDDQVVREKLLSLFWKLFIQYRQ